jgi:peptidoglycan/xylan/chitin deacetylase (PgdA/CDA1 family)
MASTGTGAVVLTFDDGPGPYTEDLLDLLDRYHVKATFCLIGRQIWAYRAVIRRMIRDGMTLCDHTWDHDEELGSRPLAAIASDVRRPAAVLQRINQRARFTYFRQPGGEFTSSIVSVAEQLGMRPLFWSVDTRDWTKPGTSSIVRSLASARAGSIVLMHDAGGDRSQTLAALKVMLPQLVRRFHLIALPTARTARVTPPRL